MLTSYKVIRCCNAFLSSSVKGLVICNIDIGPVFDKMVFALMESIVSDRYNMLCFEMSSRGQRGISVNDDCSTRTTDI